MFKAPVDVASLYTSVCLQSNRCAFLAANFDAKRRVQPTGTYPDTDGCPLCLCSWTLCHKDWRHTRWYLTNLSQTPVMCNPYRHSAVQIPGSASKLVPSYTHVHVWNQIDLLCAVTACVVCSHRFYVNIPWHWWLPCKCMQLKPAPQGFAEHSLISEKCNNAMTS